MTQGFFQFNNSIINEIRNFASSYFDLLFMGGPKGSAKSETIEKLIPELSENNLIFQHFCFKNTVIDDFLLNFYDALRNFQLAQKISLKKIANGSFKERVSHYFKTIDMNCIIVVENFDKIDSNVEIIDFLSHLASYSNVKIIVVTQNLEQNLFRFKKIKMQTLAMQEITEEEFKSKLAILSEPVDKEVKEKFYKITSGLELYLKMSAKYSSTTNTSIKDLIEEFERKNLSSYLTYEEFIVTKFISLVPAIYKNLLKILSTISHPVNVDLLEQYKLGDISHINYLTKNFLISHIKNEYYVKDYFKQYITKSFSIQEKITYYKTLIELYENELTKSPKDRLLRLSRESIRKEIEFFKAKMPSINNSEKSQNFSYFGIQTPNWFDEKSTQKSKFSEKLNKIKERKKNLLTLQNATKEEQPKEKINHKQILEEKENNRKFIIDLINSSREYARKYNYQDAINELIRAQEMDYDNEFQIEILILIAKNNESLNKYTLAQGYYEKALELADKTSDSRKCEINFLIALSLKSTFNIESAKEKFLSIVENKNNPQSYISKSYIELGEIEEANSNIEEAIKFYTKAIELEKGKDKILTCKAYYKLAILYDEHQNYDKALEFYKKNYTTSSERRENKYYSISLANSALIYYDRNNLKQAIEYLKLALIYDSEIDDWENMYYSQKELAKIYSQLDEINTIGYYKQALNSARKLNDNFKEALIYFELGEYFYDKQNDEKALINFYNAKAILKETSDTENISRVNSSIKDIKVRMDEISFNLISQKYDK